MKKAIKRIVTISIGGLAAFAVLILVLGLTGVRVNTTGSFPEGIYYLVSKQPEKGDLVFACPPNNATVQDAMERTFLGPGDCPGGVGHVFKKILAAKSDVVSVRNEGVFVNGERLINSKPIRETSDGKKMNIRYMEYYKMGESDILLMSDYSSTSFDARYFGISKINGVEGVVVPIYTWD